MQEYISVRRIVNTTTNFTAVNRSAHPYSMFYEWMCNLEAFAKKLCGIRISLRDAKELQWIYACYYFFRNPSRLSWYHVHRIYRMSKEKSLYRQIIKLKIVGKIKAMKRERGLFGMIGKLIWIAWNAVMGLLFKKEKTKLKNTTSVLIGHASK